MFKSLHDEFTPLDILKYFLGVIMTHSGLNVNARDSRIIIVNGCLFCLSLNSFGCCDELL